MISVPTPDDDPHRCPPWCDPAYCCRTGATGIDHESPTVELEAGGAEFDIMLVRLDAYAVPDQPGSPEVAFAVICTDPDRAKPVVQLYLRPEDAWELGCQLINHADLATRT